MGNNFEIDNLDRGILKGLIADARTPFSEIAKQLGVSDGTIHVRVNRLKERGIIKGSKVVVDYQTLGFNICAMIGINLREGKEYLPVLNKLRKIPEITEAHYTTGQYNLIIKVMLTSTEHLYLFLMQILQQVEGIQSTETFIVLDTPFVREASIEQVG
ncbi:MAG: Lrp/AsnC ligand binding domain-containing protein [Bdellovibrionales bacterium]|nr:Lrp/AsnC ligand binding domain-containing protein [Bdellovibrionales bacterium]